MSTGASVPANGHTLVLGSKERPLSIGTATLHLTALWGFALALPLLNLLGRTPEFFVARGNTDGDIVAIALATVIAPPLVLMALELVVVRLSRPAATWLHLGLVTLLGGLIALPPLGDLTGGSRGAVPLALLVGAVIATLYARAAFARSIATALAPAPLILLAFFLTLSPVSKLLLVSETNTEGSTSASDVDPVVVIVFDELPTTSLMNEDGELDANRFPAFARLARDATWYRNATTVAEYTANAVPALLSGRIPEDGSLPVSADYPRNLFTMLAESHKLEVTEPLTDLCPSRLCAELHDPAATRLRELASDLGIVSLHLLLPDAMTTELPAIDRTWQGFGDSARQRGQDVDVSKRIKSILEEQDEVEDAERFTAGIRPYKGGRPPLHFLHVSLPHVPWTMLPTGQQYVSGDGGIPGLEGVRWTEDPTLVNRSLERHMLQTGLADRLLGRALKKLRAAGLYDRAFVVVAADHGASFEPGGPRRAVTRSNIGDIAGVPLIVKRPGQSRGRIEDAGVRTVDVLPTIAESMRAGRNWHFDGIPLDEHSASSRPVEIYRSGKVAISAPLKDFVRARDALARRRANLLRDGPDGLYLHGPRPDLLDRQLSEFAIEPPDGTADLDSPNAWSAVDPHAALLPVEVAGVVRGARPGRSIAVALNGRIAATTTTIENEDGQATFSALLPLSGLRPGENEVVVLEPRGDTTLRELARSTALPPYHMHTDGRRLTGPRGERFTVDQGKVAGFLDSAKLDRDVVQLGGWAVAGDLSAPADRVVALAGNASVAESTPAVPRADVVQALDADPGTRDSGFSLSFPRSLLDCSKPEQGLTVLGVVERVSSRLMRARTVEQTLADACER